MPEQHAVLQTQILILQGALQTDTTLLVPQVSTACKSKAGADASQLSLPTSTFTVLAIFPSLEEQKPEYTKVTGFK